MKIAVVAHAGKTVGGGLPELRRTLEGAGVSDPLWTEVPKSKRAPAAVEQSLEEGAELILAWGGDGMVRRCVNALKGTDVPLAIVPAGTSNLFATHLGVERDIAQAVDVALHGERRKLDVGCFDGERFAVMAGAGFDAAMIKGADDLKDRLGRAAYVVGGAAELNSESFEAKIKIDGTPWYEGTASCILVGNVGELFGGIDVFADARPDDGKLDIGVLTSEGPVQLVRAAARTAVGSAEKSPFVRVTQGRKVRVKLDRKVRYELDGGDRKKVKKFKVDIEPGAITVCVPRGPAEGNGAR
ncbi:MAG TPA: diacylglycerol kinase family protein [Solirubrobacterales bacterium]|nr:diacylglycerol kinase family protein [Solirubrobacterales bacterium]